MFSVFCQTALEVLTTVEHNGTQRAVRRTKADITCWDDVHKACFVPLCGPLWRFGIHKSRSSIIFKVQVVKMMEKLVGTAVNRQRRNLPAMNTLDIAQRLLDQWNAEKEQISASKERHAQLRCDMAQVEIDNSLRPQAPATVVVDQTYTTAAVGDPPSVPQFNLPSNPPSNDQSSTTTTNILIRQFST